MITMNDLLKNPIFANFQLANNASLNRQISGTGIFDWEEPSEISKDFNAGEFVITTLVRTPDHPEIGMDGLKALIDLGVAAIAIKRIYVDTLPDDILEHADANDVPIFFFSDTYVDDIIFAVKNALLAEDSNAVTLKYIRNLIHANNPADLTSVLLWLSMQPDDICLCAACIPNPEEASSSIISKINNTDACHIIQCANCKLAVITIDNLDDNAIEFGLDLLAKLGIDTKNHKIGFGKVMPASDLTRAIRTATYSAYSACITGQNPVASSYTDINQLLASCMQNFEMRVFYENIYNKLSTYDDNHNSNLLSTLLSYAHNSQNINTTAHELYQHANTIRYRLEKIKSLLEINSADDESLIIMPFAILHDLYHAVDGEMI